MFKCHDFCTADNAYIMSNIVHGIKVFGGIALNLNYGHVVKVQAAKMATQLAGGYCRSISMPTYQSAYDMKRAEQTVFPFWMHPARFYPKSSR